MTTRPTLIEKPLTPCPHYPDLVRRFQMIEARLERIEATPKSGITPSVIPYPRAWDTLYSLDNGGPVATAAARKVIADTMDAGALGVTAGGNHADWLRPLIQEGGHRVLVNFSWNSIFRPASRYYMPDDGSRRSAWTAALRSSIGVWKPTILSMDQEDVGFEGWMTWAVETAISETITLAVQVHWYRGDSGGVGLADDVKLAPAYYYVLPVDGVAPGVSIWKQPDPVAAIRTRLADPVFNVAGTFPWISPWLQPSEFRQGLMSDHGAMAAVCGAIRDAGAIGVHWYDEGVGTSGATYEAALALQRTAANEFRGVRR